MKIIECAECGREVEVPDDIAESGIAVFCSEQCSRTDNRYAQEFEAAFNKILRRFVRRFYSRVQQGKLFEGMVRNGLKDLAEREGGGFWWMRIFDYRSFVAVNPKIVAFKQPADFMGCWHGRYLLIECKSTTLTSFRLENFKPHQEQAMRELTAAGGMYWLLILARHKGDRNHECYAFQLGDWARLKKKCADDGKLSANWAEVEAMCTRQVKRRGGVWDLKPLMEAGP